MLCFEFTMLSCLSTLNELNNKRVIKKWMENSEWKSL